MEKVVSKHLTKKGARRAASVHQAKLNTMGRSSGWSRVRVNFVPWRFGLWKVVEK